MSVSKKLTRAYNESPVLKNHGLIDTIIEKARVKPSDTLLEINSGVGTITKKLLQKAKKVIAYENNESMVRELKSKINSDPVLKNKFELIQEDIFSNDFPRFDICISNLQFNISVPVILKLLTCNFKAAYLLVQKEFAARLTAAPGSADYSRISVIVQLLSNVQHIMKVSRNSFHPSPKVDSCFVKIEPKTPRPPINIKEFDNFLKVCFVRKNKTICSNLKSSYIGDWMKKMDKYEEGFNPLDVIENIVERIGMIETRTVKMDVEDLLELMLEFKKEGISFV